MNPSEIPYTKKCWHCLTIINKLIYSLKKVQLKNEMSFSFFFSLSLFLSFSLLHSLYLFLFLSFFLSFFLFFFFISLLLYFFFFFLFFPSLNPSVPTKLGCCLQAPLACSPTFSGPGVGPSCKIEDLEILVE